MKYCKNSACKGAGGYRRKKKSGFGGYCWTCGLQFEPTRAAAARAKVSCENIACKGADGSRRQRRCGLRGYCWTCGPQFEPTLVAGARAKEKARKAMRKAQKSLTSRSLYAFGKGANGSENVQHKCNTCQRLLSKEKFSASQLKHFYEEARNKNLRCEECHVCQICCKHFN